MGTSAIVLTRGPGSPSSFPAASAFVRKLPSTETSPFEPVSSGVKDGSFVLAERGCSHSGYRGSTPLTRRYDKLMKER